MLVLLGENMISFFKQLKPYQMFNYTIKQFF
ncbi:hypothetical protein F957_02176 [Acinetobacter gyllenbergii CIP 110306 = MTCC 11365]|uniref:Uncharacterized protein n=1 Tax=Acinetobacter gyllenbergii CIP 110306 = MTCC 11365 TaxID=1217657 RepID=A0A829HJ20_9GAMM|nr:hypothetical protein F957_02176 [Acinetobacter gyllenbergii CIP 110306 = MTCC 11365]ESK53683.1 hypothetical protein F987_01021 [Acinetobacter gyllenbergii NIPH 230]